MKTEYTYIIKLREGEDFASLNGRSVNERPEVTLMFARMLEQAKIPFLIEEIRYSGYHSHRGEKRELTMKELEEASKGQSLFPF